MFKKKKVMTVKLQFISEEIWKEAEDHCPYEVFSLTVS